MTWRQTGDGHGHTSHAIARPTRTLYLSWRRGCGAGKQVEALQVKIAEMQLELDVQRRAVDDMQTRQHALQSDKKRLEDVIASFGDADEVCPRQRFRRFPAEAFPRARCGCFEVYLVPMTGGGAACVCCVWWLWRRACSGCCRPLVFLVLCRPRGSCGLLACGAAPGACRGLQNGGLEPKVWRGVCVGSDRLCAAELRLATQRWYGHQCSTLCSSSTLDIRQACTVAWAHAQGMQCVCCQVFGFVARVDGGCKRGHS